MMRIAETALAPTEFRTSPRDHLLPPRALLDAPEQVIGRIDSAQGTLTVSMLQDRVVVERRGENAASLAGSTGGGADPRMRIVVLATDHQERWQFISELASRIAAPLLGEPRPALLEVGELRIDRGAHRVEVEGREIRFTAMEYKLLLTLVERRDCVLDRRTLLHDVWGFEAEGGIRRVDVTIRRLRVKLGGAGRFVQTLRGFGYRLSERPSEQSSE